MKIIRADKPVFAEMPDGSETCYRPLTRYLASDWEAMYLMEHTGNTRWDISSFNPFERRYGGQDLNGKTILLYRHTAWGDQLMISAVPRYLKTLYPRVNIHMYCDPGVCSLWEGNPFVSGAAIPIPIPFDAVRNYDYHIIYEGMLESNGEYDQSCCYDDFFEVMGLKNVPAQFKRPYVVSAVSDYEWLTRDKIDMSSPYLVYHLSPANKNRCYPPAQGMEFVRRFLEKYPDWRVFVVGSPDEQFERIVAKCIEETKGHVVSLVGKTKKFRDTIPIIEKASLVVCPDSSIMHLAAAFDIPTISLWGVFDPHDRVAYYNNHHALVSQDGCPHSPCHNHEFQLPLEKCKASRFWVDGMSFCCALSSIQPDHIMNQVKEVIG